MRVCIFLFLSLICCSCLTVSKIDIELMRPANVSLPASLQTVGVVSLADLKIKTTNSSIQKSRDTVSVYPGKIAAQQFIKQLGNQNRIFAVNGDTLNLLAQLKPFKENIPASVLTETANALKVDGWLVIEKTDYRDSVDVDNDPYEDVFHQKKMTARYGLDVKWKLYAKDGAVLDAHYGTISDEIVENFPSFAVAFANVPSRKDLVELAASQLAGKYLARLLPYWERKERLLYSGTLDFVKAEEYLKANQMDKAIFIYRSYVNHDQVSTKAAALHNMAVVSEMKGSMEAAIDWAAQSNKILTNEYEQKYIEELQARWKEEKVIKNQLLIH